MTYEQVETFLTVVTYGTISAAANHLYVSQSTVSTRIRQLEDELGTALLYRQKGHRTIDLTACGNAFIPMAAQWTQLWKNTQNLKDLADIRTLTIASIDSVNNCTLVPLFNYLIDNNPEFKLRIHTHHSNEIHGLVESHSADIGYVFSQINYPDIISRPVYREKMYLVCHKDSPYQDDMKCSDLDPSKEVFLRWGQDYQSWHDRHWSPENYSAVTVNTGSTLQRFLDRPGRWAIAPMSIIHQMKYNQAFVHYTLHEPPQPRMCYELVNRYLSARQRSSINFFREELEKFVRSNEDICVFEPWMLDE